jgi:hypothetical protein
MDATGMKQARRVCGGESRQEGAKPCRRNEPGEANPGITWTPCAACVEGAETPGRPCAGSSVTCVFVRDVVQRARVVKPWRGRNSVSALAAASATRRIANGRSREDLEVPRDESTDSKATAVKRRCACKDEEGARKPDGALPAPQGHALRDGGTP